MSGRKCKYSSDGCSEIELHTDGGRPDSSGYTLMSEAISTSHREAPAIPYLGSHCPFFGVVNMMPMIKNGYAILIGPSVCLYNARIANDLKSLGGKSNHDNCFPLNITHEDVVFGVYEKIKKTVLRVIRSRRVDVLFLVTTCVLEITGEDIDSIVKEIQPDTQTPLLVIHTEHFTGSDHGWGIEQTYLSLSDLMSPQPVDPKGINLLGFRSMVNKPTELSLILGQQGFNIHTTIPSYCSLEEISKAPAATLNIVLERAALSLAEKMQRQFGTQFVYADRPYAVDSITHWYDCIAEKIGINLSKNLTALKQSATEIIAKYRTAYSGKTYILSALDLRIGRPFDLLRLLTSLGLRPLLVILKEDLSSHEQDVKAALENGINPKICMDINGLRQKSVLNEFCPDFMIGGVHNEQKEYLCANVHPRDLLPSYFVLGYERIHKVLDALNRQPSSWEIRRYRELLLKEAENN